MALHPLHTIYPFTPGPKAWRIPDVSCSAPEWQRPNPPKAASALGLRDKLRGVEEIRMEESWYTWASQIPQLTEQRDEKDYFRWLHNKLWARAKSLSNIQCYGSTRTSATRLKQTSHRERGQSMWMWKNLWMNCYGLCILFSSSWFIYLCLSCSTKISVQHS